MKDWTGVEIDKARQGLEQAAAVLLGRMIFEFSRLDVALGLMLVWAHDGTKVNELTKTVARDTFHKKLDYLEKLAKTKYDGNQEALDAHKTWLEEAHNVRSIRNDMIHGRWDDDPIGGRMINVVGPPTGAQIKTSYTIAELKTVLVRMQTLNRQLPALRWQWPV